MSSFHLEPLCGVQCSTVGTGNYACGTALPGMCTFALVYADSDTFTYCARDTAGNFEEGLGSYVAASNQIVRVAVYTAGTPTSRTTATPFAWSSGVRNLFIDFPSSHGNGGVMYGGNNGSEFVSPSAVRGVLGLGSAALVATGTTAGTLALLATGGKHAALPGDLLTTLPLILTAPSNTVLLVAQSAAPPGWQVVTTSTDVIAMVTDSNTGAGHPAGGSTGGVPGTWSNSWGLSVSGHALTSSEVPAMNSGTVASGGGVTVVTGLTGAAGAAHTHGITDAATWRPPFLAVIQIKKT